MINAKADPDAQRSRVSEDFRGLLHVLQEDYNAKEEFARILTANLDKVNEDPVTRRKIMTFQTRLEDEKAIGIEEGRRKGLQEGRREGEAMAARKYEIMLAKEKLTYFYQLVTDANFSESKALNFLRISREDLEKYKKIVADSQQGNKK